MIGHRHGKGLYKDSEEGIVMGVCAGLANYLDFSRNGIRLMVVLAALLFMFWPIVIAYFIAGFVLKHRPLCYCGRDERDFWRRSSHAGRTL